MPKLIAIVGEKHSGKTTIIENIVTELKKRGYTVGVIKEMVRIPTLDTPQKETDRYTLVGAEKIVAVPRTETVIFIKKRLSLEEILPYLEDLDYAILEGFEHEQTVQKIVAAKNFEEVHRFMDASVVAVSGLIMEFAKERSKAFELKVPLFSSLTHADQLVNLIE